jgi:hypothetical protein
MEYTIVDEARLSHFCVKGKRPPHDLQAVGYGIEGRLTTSTKKCHLAKDVT